MKVRSQRFEHWPNRPDSWLRLLGNSRLVALPSSAVHYAAAAILMDGHLVSLMVQTERHQRNQPLETPVLQARLFDTFHRGEAEVTCDVGWSVGASRQVFASSSFSGNFSSQVAQPR